MPDVRTITNVDNKFGCKYKVDLLNQQSTQSVTVFPGKDEPTGDIPIPWCDSQQDLDSGRCIKITFSKKGASNIENYMFQHGSQVYLTNNKKQFGNKQIISGDSEIIGGNYKLNIKTNGDLPRMVLSKY
ncbi:hypothetical protein [Photorhabdus africana]|uniref:hypothetical protein n=1 Tax=Photorhabdus africana TaxID=3097554 RepID=UPI002B410743|nr:hypothetical protein [Photorhabdus sp. CRI-LC]